MKNLQISVNDIKELGRVSQGPEKYYSKDIEDLVKKQDLSVSFTLSDCENEILLTGEISGTIVFECSLCLEESVLPIDIKICESFPSTDEFINVDEEIKQQLILGLPEKPLCRPDCKGLCCVCGSNKNIKECNCTTETIDPRWDKLKNIIK